MADSNHIPSRTVEYRTWRGMHDRCYNSNLRDFHRYGGRGIKVCERWHGPRGFANFLADMGRRPSDKHSIDRYPDNDGDYSPDNCRWATKTEQMLNRRNPVRTLNLIFNGTFTTYVDLAKRVGISYGALRDRLVNRGWSLERALSQPVKRPKLTFADAQQIRQMTAAGMMQKKIAAIFKVNVITVRKIVAGKWHAEK